MRKTVLVTGASSGIGYEFVKLFAKDRFNLVLVARDIKKLEDIKKEIKEKDNELKVHLIKKDLSNKGAAKEIYEEVTSLGIMIHSLVNNAGFGLMGNFTDLDREKQLNMINLNVIALTDLTYFFLTDMKKNRKGKILNVASLAALSPGPKMAVYYATKAFVLSFSEALQDELRFSGITVTALCPGATKSKFSTVADANRSILFLLPMSTKRAALTGYVAMKFGITMIVPGIMNKVFAIWMKIMPGIVNSQFVKLISINIKPKKKE